MDGIQFYRHISARVASVGVIDMRLIDADALIVDLQHRCSNETFYKQVKESLIDCAPTIDAVEVVRCKDCFYSEPLSDYMKKQYGDNVVRCNHPHFGLNLMKKELFCCFGEHKDGD